MVEPLVELHAKFEHLKSLALRRHWSAPEPATLQIRLSSVDAASEVPFEPLGDFVRRMREMTGISLRLTGGGYGCFDLIFSGDLNLDPCTGWHTNVENIICDPELERAINELRMHQVRVDTPAATATYRAFNDIQLGIATNRKAQASSGNPRNIFGSDIAKDNTYGVADLSVSDMAKHQPEDSLLKRAWRRVENAIGVSRSPQVILRKVDLFTDPQFRSFLRGHVGRGAILVVHGYANSFSEAIDGCAIAAHRSRFGDLGFMPVMFSWPADGSPADYLRDTNMAECSEMNLFRALELLSSVSSENSPSVVAHSHGNKLLIRSIATAIRSQPDRAGWLDKLVLIEPDVDQTFLEQRAPVLAESAQSIVIYHTQNDRALKVASLLFASTRAGRAGVRPEETDFATARKMQIIDATAVAGGWTRHAPHIESDEVAKDLHSLFKGQSPEKREGLKAAGDSRWSIHPSP